MAFLLGNLGDIIPTLAKAVSDVRCYKRSCSHLKDLITTVVPMMKCIPKDSPGGRVWDMFEKVVKEVIRFIRKVGDYHWLMITVKGNDIRIKIEEFRVRINDVMNAANLAVQYVAVTSDRAPLILKSFPDEDFRLDDEDAKEKLKINSVEAISTEKTNGLIKGHGSLGARFLSWMKPTMSRDPGYEQLISERNEIDNSDDEEDLVVSDGPARSEFHLQGNLCGSNIDKDKDIDELYQLCTESIEDGLLHEAARDADLPFLALLAGVAVVEGKLDETRDGRTALEWARDAGENTSVELLQRMHDTLYD